MGKALTKIIKCHMGPNKWQLGSLSLLSKSAAVATCRFLFFEIGSDFFQASEHRLQGLFKPFLVGK